MTDRAGGIRTPAMSNRTKTILLWVVIASVVVLAIICSGCAKEQLVAPQGGAMTGGISRVQAGTTTAQAQRAEIARRNAEARANLERADSKDALIRAWRVWKKEHP